MHTYRLKYDSDRYGVEKAIEFEAANAAGALKFARSEARGRWGELYEDGRPICRLERVDPQDANIWIVVSEREE